MALGADDLVLSYMAMTRVEPVWQFHPASFEDRCVAAAAGGFAGIGLVPVVYDEARAAGYSDAELQAMLSDRGLVVAEVEYPESMPGPAGEAEMRPILEHTLEIADLFGAERVMFVAAPGLSEAEVVRSFRLVSDLCAEHDLLASIEFVPIPSHASVHDAREAVRVVQATDRPNAGITVDSCHHFNGANDWEALEAIPGEYVATIQFDDTDIPRLEPDWAEGTPHHRRAPGEGDADLIRFVQTMDAIGADRPYSTEVIDAEIVRLEPAALGRRLGGSTRGVLEAARRLEHEPSA
jgi:sugar phosphate isomerase/epimerase